MEYERSLVKKFKGLPIEILGINADTNSETTRKRFAEEKGTWRSLDCTEKAWGEFLPDFSAVPQDSLGFPAGRSIPQFFLLDKTGIIRAYQASGVNLKSNIVLKAQELLIEMGHDAELVSDEEIEDDLREIRDAKRSGQIVNVVRSWIAKGKTIDDNSIRELIEPETKKPQEALSSLRGYAFSGLSTVGSSQASRILGSVLQNAEDPNELNAYGSFVADLIQRDVFVTPKLQRLGRAAIEKAIDLAPEDPNCVDSLARMAFYADNDVARAISLEEKALKLAGDDETLKRRYSRFLKLAREKLADDVPEQ